MGVYGFRQEDQGIYLGDERKGQLSMSGTF